MIDILSYGMIAGAAILALVYGLPAWLVYRKRPPVRVIVNARPPWLYDENHIDRPTYQRKGARVYSVWVDGSEVNDYYLTEKQAENLAFEYEIDGYENVTIRKEKGE